MFDESLATRLFSKQYNWIGSTHVEQKSRLLCVTSLIVAFITGLDSRHKMLWGYGPAVDILEEISVDFTLQKQEELNILVIGFADGRHILQTIAKFYKHPKKKVHFFVSEVILDMIARQLLLIMTALEPLDKIGLLEKTHLWMELYGNTLIRPNTRKHLVKKAYQLIHMVTDDKYLTYRLPLVDLSWMKYKERDNLETIFQFWAKDRYTNCYFLQ